MKTEQPPHVVSGRVRDQPHLTTESGTTWVVVAATSIILLGAMLIVLGGPTEVTIASCTLMVVLLLSMGVFRAGVRPIRARLVTLAALYATILAAVFGATLLAALEGRSA